MWRIPGSQKQLPFTHPWVTFKSSFSPKSVFAILQKSFRGLDSSIPNFFSRCPKTVENFCVHARNGYFNGHLFHRVIKGFMIQTGDPMGTLKGLFESNAPVVILWVVCCRQRKRRRVDLGRRVRGRISSKLKARSSVHTEHGECRSKHKRLTVLHNCCSNGNSLKELK